MRCEQAQAWDGFMKGVTPVCVVNKHRPGMDLDKGITPECVVNKHRPGMDK